MDLAWVMAMLVGASAVLWMQRGKAAQREVDRLVGRGGLPPDPDLVEPALRWLRRRQETVILGVLTGTLAGGLIVLLIDQVVDIKLVDNTGLDVRLLTWLLGVTAAVGGFATLAHSYRTVRASQGVGPRTAALRPRRLSDYLSPVEIAIHHGAVAVPLIAAGLGVVVLGSADHPERGWILVISGLLAVPLCAAGLLLQRMALGVHQPSGREAELRWQEALRATTLRDLGSAVVTVSWLLGAAIPLAFEWPHDVPGFVGPLDLVLFGVSLLAVVVVSLVALSRRGLQRVQRVVG